MSDPRMINPYLPVFGQNWLWFLIWGLVLLTLGIFAIVYSTIATLLSVIVLGFVIFASGIVIIMDSFTFWRGKRQGFFLHLIMGILYFVVGLTLIAAPMWASMSLTLLLGIFYIFIGLSRIYYSMSMKTPRWGWSFFNGLIALLLGVLILAQWPTSSLFIIGLFIGIDLIFAGWAYVITALSGRRHQLSV